MHTGQGHLILHDGRRLALNFQFSSPVGSERSGYLHLDTSSIDPASFASRLDMVCDDGTLIELLVVHFSDRYLAMTGLARPIEGA